MRSTTTAAPRARPVPGERLRFYHLRDIDRALWTQVKVRAAQDNIPIRTVILRALERYAAGKS
jgi:hypothetical protein